MAEKIEREYVIPLREKYQHVPRYKKTPKAVKTIKEFIARHMKIYDGDLNKIKVDSYVNEYMWGRGIKNPPHKIKVKAIKDSEGLVRVELVEYPDKLKFKKARAEKHSKEALAKVESKKTLKERMQESVKGAVQGRREDKNADGVDDKKELEEKKEAVKESTEKMEKEMAKEEKHTTKPEKSDKKKEHSKGDNKK
jgi:large subunit ribosomal protein L31e